MVRVWICCCRSRTGEHLAYIRGARASSLFSKREPHQQTLQEGRGASTCFLHTTLGSGPQAKPRKTSEGEQLPRQNLIAALPSRRVKQHSQPMPYLVRVYDDGRNGLLQRTRGSDYRGCLRRRCVFAALCIITRPLTLSKNHKSYNMFLQMRTFESPCHG